MTMTHDERWIAKFNEVVGFIESNQRNPSRHRIEEHDMLNWLKATRKRMNSGKLQDERVEMACLSLHTPSITSEVASQRSCSTL